MNPREEIAQAARAAGWAVRYPNWLLAGPALECERGPLTLRVFFNGRISRVDWVGRIADGAVTEVTGGKRAVLKIIKEEK